MGWLAILLPVVVAGGYWFFGGERGGFLDSISESYFTLMRDAFVGTLSAVAFFLYAYRGYDRFEDRLFNVLGLLCVVIAVFSMNSRDGAPDAPTDPPLACHYAIHMTPACLILLNNRVLLWHREWFGWIHIGAAAVLFVSLGYVSLFLFTKTRADGVLPTRKKRWRNVVYRVCGVAIWVSLLGYAILAFGNVLEGRPVLYAAETVCLVAFGLSWLVKGNGVFGLAEAR